MEFATWRDYLNWLQNAQLPLFTRALGLKREAAFAHSKRERHEQEQVANVESCAEACSKATGRVETMVAHVKEEVQDVLQLSAEFDQLARHAREQTAELQRHPVHVRVEQALAEAKRLEETATVRGRRNTELDALNLAASVRLQELALSLERQRAALLREEKEHQGCVAASEEQMRRLQAERSMLEDRLRSAESRLQELRGERQLSEVREAELHRRHAAASECMAQQEVAIRKLNEESTAAEFRLAQTERKAGDLARKNLKLILEIESAAEATGLSSKRLADLVRDLEFQETSIEEVPFRMSRLRAELEKNCKMLAVRFYAKKVLQAWRENSAAVRAVRLHREACRAEEEQWVQDLKGDYQKKAKSKKARGRKKDNAKHAKRRSSGLSIEDLCTSFKKMEK